VISIPSAATANDSRAINSIAGQFWWKKSVASWKLHACTRNLAFLPAPFGI